MAKEVENLDLDPDLNTENNKKYKVKTIKNSTFYIRNTRDQLSDLYYLIFEKATKIKKISRSLFQQFYILKK